MGESKQLILGIDLTDEYTQVCCYQYQNNEAASVNVSMDSSNPLIPTCLLIKESNKEWVFGEEAVRLNGLYGGIFLDHLIARLLNHETVLLYDTEWTPTALLTKYFKKLLGYLRQHYLNSTIAKLVITVDNLSPLLVEKIYESLKLLGLERDRVIVISHVECFMYYILSQKQDLWSNDVGLFHFDKQGLIYYRLIVNRHTLPAAVIVNKMDLSEELSLSDLEKEEPERLVTKFENIANQLLFKRLTTSLFFTGPGFLGEWIYNTLKKLCVGRRVFKGQNLYVKGACYAAKAIYHEELKEFILVSDEMITTSIGIRIYHNSKEEVHLLAEAGTPWWQVNNSITVIMDETNELEFTITNLLKREPVKEVLKIDGLMERENKTIRLQLQLQFVDRDTAVLHIRDTGFGTFYETTYRIWEQNLT